MSLSLLFGTALACGGFACDQNTQTNGELLLAQNGERILFVVHEDDTITTHVEVGFVAKERMDFSWIIPIPEAIPASGVTTQPADMFNQLDEATAPRLETTYVWTNPEVPGTWNPDPGGGGGWGCSLGCNERDLSSSGGPTGGSGGDTAMDVEEATVSVTDEAVVGPFAIEVITATDVADFQLWLADNGYMLPEGGEAALQHYIDAEMAFLGVQLAPLGTLGPIDTLSFTYPGTEPMIPIILTSIGAVEDMPITVWVAGPETFGPGNYAEANLDEWDLLAEAESEGVLSPSGYEAVVQDTVDGYGGHAFVQQWVGGSIGLSAVAPLGDAASVTRWTARISPDEMTLDPTFVPRPYSNFDGAVSVTLFMEPPTGAGLWLFGLPLVILGVARRRR